MYRTPFRLDRRAVTVSAAAGILLLIAVAVPAQEPGFPAGPAKIAVIDVARIIQESAAGKKMIEELRARQSELEKEAEPLAKEAEALNQQIEEGKLSLAEDRLAKMRKDLQQLAIRLKRLEDDSNLELNQMREERLGEIEAEVMPVIQQVGAEYGFSAVFNKFQSGLVYATDEIDITDIILKRFDEVAAAEE